MILFLYIIQKKSSFGTISAYTIQLDGFKIVKSLNYENDASYIILKDQVAVGFFVFILIVYLIMSAKTNLINFYLIC